MNVCQDLRRVWRTAALCLVFSLLAGCSALRLSYNQADWLAYRWLDAYADFDDVQAVHVREAIIAWFVWHRRTQLADYADLLLRIDAEVLADTSAERVCGWWSAVRTRIDRSLTQAVPAIADVARTLSPAQFGSIERRYSKSNAEYRDEFLQTNLAVRGTRTLKRTIGRSERLYGELDPFQHERLARWIAGSPFDPELYFNERTRRQQDALQTLRHLTGEPIDGALAQAQIRGWLQRYNRSPREPYRRYAERVVEHNCKLAADLHNSTSPAQRQSASAKLRGWAADLRALASDAVGH